jgi:glycosyltransferase involved in cell wall biosynthesis
MEKPQNSSFRVLWITQNYPPSKGGMSESCDRIVYNLRQSGLVIDVLHLFERATHAKVRNTKGGREFIFPIDADIAHTFNLVWNFLEENQPSSQWTHLVAFGGYLPLLAAPVLKCWLNIPLMTCIRGNDFDAAIFSPKRREVLYEALRNSAAVGAVSQDKAQKIKAIFPHISTYFTPNGIDCDIWQAHDSDYQAAQKWRETHLTENRKLVGLFGHLKEKKGIVFFLKALGLAQKNEQIHLLFVGELAEEVKDFLREHGDAFHYTHYPFMDRFSLLPYYLACDALAIPSFYDGMPNVLLEAGALGVPLISANVAGMKDVLEDKKHGFLFAPNDTKAAMRVLFDFSETDESTLKTMGQNIQNHLKSQFTIEAETKNYQQIFQEMSGL